MAHGGEWLSAHPERALIARRFLRYKRPLVTPVLERLAESDPALAEAEVAEAKAEERGEPREVSPGLHEQRLNAVLAAIRAVDARSLIDLGCGEGRLLELALRERGLKRIIGIDVSSLALAKAHRRLHLDEMAPAKRAR